MSRHMDEIKVLRATKEPHYNCSQSLLVAFSDVLGITKEEAYALGQNFGTGMLSGGTCGTLTSAFMILGVAGFSQAEATKVMVNFKAKHESITCAELLKKSRDAGIERKPHCDALVFEMTDVLDAMLETHVSAK